jgi:hypothetical protein
MKPQKLFARIAYQVSGIIPITFAKLVQRVLRLITKQTNANPADRTVWGAVFLKISRILAKL